MRTLYQTFGMLAVVMVLALCSTNSWAQTDTKVTYNKAGVPVISRADAAAPTKEGRPVGGNTGAVAPLPAGVTQADVDKAVSTKPSSITVDETNGVSRMPYEKWEADYKAWLQGNTAAKASLSQTEYNFIANGDYPGLYRHLQQAEVAQRRSQTVK